MVFCLEDKKKNEEKQGKLTVGHEMDVTSDIELGFPLRAGKPWITTTPKYFAKFCNFVIFLI